MPLVEPLIRLRNERALRAFAKQSQEAEALASAHTEAQRDPGVAASGYVKAIEAVRHEYSQRDEPLVDGTLGESVPWDQGRTIADASRVSRSPDHAAYLYHLIRQRRPKRVLELGTNLGISGSYIAAALKEHGGGELVTMDASPYRQRLAKDLFERVGLDNARFVLGDFADTFDRAVQEHGPFDFAFIDGNHTLEPTLHYAESVCEAADEDVWVVFDDIRWSEGMEEAWRRLRKHPRMLAGLDLYRLSLCVMSSASGNGAPKISPPLYGAFR